MPTQQERLYASEVGLDVGRTFRTIKEAQQWIDALVETTWWGRLCPNVLAVEIDWGRLGRFCVGVGWFEKDKNVGRMEFRRGAALTEGLLIHELAHVIAEARCGSQSHDPWFARVMLELTYLIRGSAPYAELKQHFDQFQIDYDAEGLARR